MGGKVMAYELNDAFKGTVRALPDYKTGKRKKCIGDKCREVARKASQFFLLF